MGPCMNKQKLSGFQKNPRDQIESRSKTIEKKKQANPEAIDMKIPPRFEEYLTRKYVTICDSQTNPAKVQHMSQFFAFLRFEQTTLKNMYELWRQNEPQLTYKNFKEGYFSLLKMKEKKTSLIIYKLYFSSMKHEGSLKQFKKQFQIFLKGIDSQIFERKIRVSNNSANSQQKFIDLEKILISRKNIDQNRQTVNWLIQNINFTKFKNYFLEGSLQIDERSALDAVIEDIINPLSEGRVGIISLSWVKKFDEYARKKFNLKGEEISGLTSQTYHFSDRKSNVRSGDYGSKIAPSKIKNSSTLSDKTIEPFKIESYEIEDYPGQIDNKALAGNFAWQLKKNIRPGHDYIILKIQTVKQLALCFGTNLFFGRNFRDKYLQTKLYFVVTYIYAIDSNGKSHLTQKNIQDFFPTQKMEEVMKKIQEKEQICFHRNIGGNWQAIPKAYQTEKQQEVHEYFTETSFCVRMDKNSLPKFQQEYIFVERDPTKIPQIGDMYKKSLNQTNIGQPPIKVCVSDEVVNDEVAYVVLHQNLEDNYCQRKGKINDFKKKFFLQKNPFEATLMLKKDRAGITNLGNTCYMGSSLQALFGLPRIKKILEEKKRYGKALLNILEIIQDRKKSCFPNEFKNIVDEDFPLFRGTEQQDAHEFMLGLLGKLQGENREIFNEYFEGKIKTTKTCKRCQNKTEIETTTPIVTLPLLDFDKKEVKIDLITGNVRIQTVIFEIPQECTIKEWYDLFKKTSGAENPFFCHLENADIEKSYDISGIMDEKYMKLKIESNQVIAAYDIKLHKTREKLQKYHNFKAYMNPTDGQYYISMVNENGSIATYYEQQLPNEEKRNSKKGKAVVEYTPIFYKKLDSIAFSATVPDTQLLAYPEKAPAREVYLKVINFDNRYSQKIGRPFVFKMLVTSPLAAVGEAIYHSLNSSSYFIRLACKDQPEVCIFCNKSCFKKCFDYRKNQFPIEWFEGRADYVLVWDNAHDYQRQINRVKFTPKDKTSEKEFDDFYRSKKRMEVSETINIDQCDSCKERNVDMEHYQKVSLWPRNVILHLKRFTMKRGQLKKIHTRWKLQTQLQIDGVPYKLLSVILHIGASSTYGHYISASQGFKFDDEMVSIQKFQDIPPEQIYMLVYSRK